jgi:hypothetical protein
LHELNPVQVMFELARVQNALGPLVSSTPVAAPQNGKPSDWIAWMAALEKWDAAPKDETQADSPEASSDAWEFWRWRLRIQSAKKPVTVAVLRQAVSGTGAFAVLKLPVEAMTVRDWSLAFHRAIAAENSDVPKWVAIAALYALGWNERARQFIAHRAQLDQWVPLIETDARASAQVVIASEEGSLSESWRPERACAALVLRVEEWSQLTRKLASNPKALLEALDHDLVAVDISGPHPMPSSRRRGARWENAREFYEWFSQSGRAASNPTALIVTEPPTEGVPPRFRLVVRPKSLGDFIANAVPRPTA